LLRNVTTLVDLLCGIFTDPMWAWQWSLKRYLCGQCTAGHVAMFHVPYRGRSTITCWISFGCKCGFPVVTWLAMCVCVCVCVQERCQNYIRVIARQSHSRLLVCGTNAFRPFCRTYQYTQVLWCWLMCVWSALSVAEFL